MDKRAVAVDGVDGFVENAGHTGAPEDAGCAVGIGFCSYGWRRQSSHQQDEADQQAIRPQRRLPRPEHPETECLDVLAEHGIETGDYHFPLWPSSDSEGLHACLRKIFGATPPTALIVREAKVFVATQRFLSSRGIAVPEDVSLICPDGEAVLDWQRPSAAQFKADSALWVRRTVRWAENISRGRDDRRQVLYPVRFVAGGTIGPAPGAD